MVFLYDKKLRWHWSTQHKLETEGKKTTTNEGNHKTNDK